MQIGIISDSHFKLKDLTESSFFSLFAYLKKLFADVDFIIHAGDVCIDQFIDRLTEIAPVKVVRGNMDTNSNWSESLFFKFDQVTIGVIHQIESISSLPSIPRILVYGHTHIAEIKEETNVYLRINPGSLTRPRIGHSILPFSIEGSIKSPVPTIAVLIIEDDIISAYLEKIPPKHRFTT